MKIRWNVKFIIIAIIFFWLCCSSSYIILTKKNLYSIAGSIVFFCQVGLDLLAIVLTFNLYKITKDQHAKNIYLLFSISFVFAMLADSIYNLTINILHIKYFSECNSFFELPYVLFLFFQILAWCQIFLTSETINIKKYPYVSYITASSLIFLIFTFGVSWKIKYLSILGAYQIVDTILEAFGFTIATICLARSNLRMINIISTGFLIIVSSDLIIRHNVVSGITPYLSPFETTWILGLALMAIGFFLSKDKKLIF